MEKVLGLPRERQREETRPTARAANPVPCLVRAVCCDDSAVSHDVVVGNRSCHLLRCLMVFFLGNYNTMPVVIT